MGLSRVEYAYRKIKNNITTNVFPSGFQILEPELAESLGVSRTPVREALIRLEADSLIKLIPRRGMRVSSLTATDVKEISQILNALLGNSLNRFCIDSAALDFNHIDSLLIDLAQLELSSSDIAAWVLQEEQFVLALVSDADNRRLKDQVRQLLEQVRRVKVIVYELSLNQSEQLNLIRGLVAALREKDPTSIREALKLYLQYFVGLALVAQDKHGLQSF